MTKKKQVPIIGFEIHVELSTQSKMFCSCPADHFAKEPNTQTCPVCLGLPGALPIPNQKAIEDTVMIGLAFHSEINQETKFDRKHYFYPDLSKSYQISQYDQPICHGGYVTLDSGKKIRLTRIHLEEDTGKLQHRSLNGEAVSLVDFNRSGVPLVEFVSEPDLSNSIEVKEFLKKIRRTVRALGVSNADMEKGSMRLEANISIGDPDNLPDYKVEIKNVNSFRYICNAIDYELKRQQKLLDQGEKLTQETRGWNQEKKETFSQRIKEESADYRYFPEPDIPPISISNDLVEDIKKNLPQLPQEKIDQLTKLGIEKRFADHIADNPAHVNLVVALADQKDIDINKLANYIVNGKINPDQSTDQVKKLYLALTDLGITDTKIIEKAVDTVIKKNQKAVSDYQAGNQNTLGFLIGQVMQETQGKANPQSISKVLLVKLKNSQ